MAASRALPADALSAPPGACSSGSCLLRRLPLGLLSHLDSLSRGPLDLEELDRGDQVEQLGVAPVARVEVRRLLDDVRAYASEVGPAVVVRGRVDPLAQQLDQLGVPTELARALARRGRRSQIHLAGFLRLLRAAQDVEVDELVASRHE